jgi:hypothetical protein
MYPFYQFAANAPPLMPYRYRLPRFHDGRWPSCFGPHKRSRVRHSAGAFLARRADTLAKARCAGTRIDRTAHRLQQLSQSGSRKAAVIVALQCYTIPSKDTG